MQVRTTVEEIGVTNDNGREIPGLCVTCDRCGHSVEVYGTSQASARRGAIMLREECPNNLKNFYVTDWEEFDE